MSRVFVLGVPAAMLAVALLLGASSPVNGVWQGNWRGKKAVTVTIREENGRLAGGAVFYITDDEGSGEHSGSASGEIPLINPVWDGKTLRFSVEGPHGESGAFTMKLNGADTAELSITGRNISIEMRRSK